MSQHVSFHFSYERAYGGINYISTEVFMFLISGRMGE
jgi:hypothetical protein